MNPLPQAVLFDLDGTLADTAPDLAGAVNDLRLERGLPALPFAQLRPLVGSGARGMVGAAFGCVPGDAGFDDLKDAFLTRYSQRLLVDSRLFDGIDTVLQALERRHLPWGVVTNKVMRYTAPIVEGLGLSRRAAVIIAGDTAAHAKPHPAPLFEAAARIGVAPAACVYVGDDLRDMQAGRAASMRTVAAAWGYLGCAEPIDAWDADFCAARPRDLLQLFDLT